MESERLPPAINGIDLNNYYPKQVSYNSVVYVHKRFLDTSKEAKEKPKKYKDKKPKKKGKGDKCDKSQQVEDVTITEFNPEMLVNSGLLGHSVQFARNLVPVVIPPSGIVSPIYYTIKATKKSKKKPKGDISNVTYKKEKSKRIVETFRNEKGSQKESLSVKETVSYTSQSDTLDELQINPSLCCTLSDVSDHKQVKKERREKPKHGHKLAPSESFEALATEFLNSAGDSKIKIHLMNETEKNLLAENIRQPLLKAIRECVLEINNQSQYHQNNEVTTVQKFVKCNTQKIDNVIDKLTCIEQKIEKLDKYIENENTKAKALKVELPKASTLEQLGEDLLELKEESSGDEYYPKASLSARRRTMGVSAVVQLEAPKFVENKEGIGAGECSDVVKPGGGLLVKPDRLSRIPARHCWTDGARKNAA